MNPEDPNFNPGGLPFVPTGKEWLYRDIGAGFAPFDWKKGWHLEQELGRTLVTREQSPTSCGGHAGGKLMTHIECAATGTYEDRSPKDIYSAIAVLQNSTPIGSRIDDIFQYLLNTGDALESLRPSVLPNGATPPDEFMLRADATPAAIESRKYGRLQGYAYVQSQIDLVAQAASLNHGLVTLLGGQNNGTWKSKYPKPPSYRQWGHFVCSIGAEMVNGKKFVQYMNSDPEAGEKGRQWLGEDYFASGFMEAHATGIYRLPPVEKFKFSRDLYLGISGPDVLMLQKRLNAEGFIVAPSGPGSVGQETPNFGPLTKAAVQRLQVAKGISPTEGYCGMKTRGWLNTH